jgi:hypothetical protein
MIRVALYRLNEDECELVAYALSYGYILNEPPRGVPPSWLSAQEDRTAWYEQLRLAFMYPARRGKTTALGSLNLVRRGFDSQQLWSLAQILEAIKAAWTALEPSAPEMAKSLERARAGARAAVDAVTMGVFLTDQESE